MREPANVTVDPRIANAAEALLPLIVANLHDAVLITEGEAGPSGSRLIIFVNRAFTAMTGFSEEEARARTPDLTIGPETDRAALYRIQEARAARVPIREELLKYRKDGSTFWAELDVFPVLDGSGACTHFVGVMRDATERKLAASSAAKARREAELGSSVLALAQQIEAPLGALTTNLVTMSERIPAEPRPVLAEMHEAAMRLEGIVRELRALVGTIEGSGAPAARADAVPERLRILIVDDDDLVLRSVGRVVAKRHEVVPVSSASRALAVMAEQATPFDAILCDVTMPVIDGLAFHDRVRGLGSGLESRIIFMTGGRAEHSEQLAGLPNACIEKPIHTPSLFAAIDAIAKRAR